MIYSRMSVADAILGLVKAMLGEDDPQEILLEGYKNGRENGYALKTYDNGKSKCVCFSEHRSSDSIIVYFGNTVNFSLQGNTPDDDVWKVAKSFKPGEYEKAAKFIYKKIKEM